MFGSLAFAQQSYWAQHGIVEGNKWLYSREKKYNHVSLHSRQQKLKVYLGPISKLLEILTLS